jgi:hypothetical protein
MKHIISDTHASSINNADQRICQKEGKIKDGLNEICNANLEPRKH